MDVSYLERLEQKYNFQYPLFYKRLCKDGMLNTGKYGPSWQSSVLPLIKSHPIFLLWADDFEQIEEGKLEEYIEHIKDPEYPAINPELSFIPFGKTGGGDWFCFYFNEQKGEDVPVAQVYHDMTEFVVLAKNIEDYMFRCLVEAVINFYIGDEDDIDKELKEYIENARLMLKSHKEYLSEERYMILEQIYSREPKESDEGWGLITLDEADELIKKYIDFPLLDEEFSYE